MRAIFGEKAGDVRDASLKAPPGLKGIVIDTQIFSRKERTEEAKRREAAEKAKVKRQFNSVIDEIKALSVKRLTELLNGYTSNTIRNVEDSSVVIRAGMKYKEDSLEGIDLETVSAEEGWCQEARRK